MGFLFHCPPLYVPFPCFAVLSLVSLFFFPLCFRLCSLFTSIVFSPSVFFRSQLLSISPASSPGFFVLLGFTLVFLSLVSALFFLVFLPPVRGFLSRFWLPKISLSLSVSWLPFSPWFLPSVRGFLFSLASSVSLRRNRGMQVCYSSSFFLLQSPPPCSSAVLDIYRQENALATPRVIVQPLG